MNAHVATYAIRLQALLADCFPAIALVLGSGFNVLVKLIQDARFLPYSQLDIDGFPLSTVPGHNGRFVAGTIAGKKVVVMDGRVHLYEGYPVDQVVLPIRMLVATGCRTIILTNATGGIKRSFQPGDLVLVRGHINLFNEANPMFGLNERYGKRFQDPSDLYDSGLRELAVQVAHQLDDEAREKKGSAGSRINLRHGAVLNFWPGPQMETPDEVLLFERLGADLTGMSIIPEALAAFHMGAKVLAISCVANRAAGTGGAARISHEEVLREVGAAGERAARLIEGIIRALPDPAS